MEGMRGWVRRHGPSLDRASTRVIVLETLGSPELILLEGEGMIRMTDYDPEVRDFLAAAARRRRAAAARAARSASPPTRCRRCGPGYATATLASCDEYKMPGQLPLAARHPAQRRLRDGRRRRAAVAEAAIRRAASARG